jgi:hypothetical protein
MTLSEYVEQSFHRPFKWGEHDCTLFVINWIKEATGKDFLETLPKWNSEREALGLIKSLGGLEKACDDRLKRIPVVQAKNGDIGMIDKSLCLFIGPRIVATGVNGLIYFNRGDAKCAWQYY